MVITSERGRHRGPSGEYVYQALGALVRLDDPAVALRRDSAYGDDAEEARQNLRENLLVVARQEEKIAPEEGR